MQRRIWGYNRRAAAQIEREGQDGVTQSELFIRRTWAEDIRKEVEANVIQRIKQRLSSQDSNTWALGGFADALTASRC